MNGVWNISPNVEVVKNAIRRVSEEVVVGPSVGQTTRLGAERNREGKVVRTRTTVRRGFNAKAAALALEIKKNPRRLWGLITARDTWVTAVDRHVLTDKDVKVRWVEWYKENEGKGGNKSRKKAHRLTSLLALAASRDIDFLFRLKI